MDLALGQTVSVALTVVNPVAQSEQTSEHMVQADLASDVSEAPTQPWPPQDIIQKQPLPPHALAVLRK